MQKDKKKKVCAKCGGSLLVPTWKYCNRPMCNGKDFGKAIAPEELEYYRKMNDNFMLQPKQ